MNTSTLIAIKNIYLAAILLALQVTMSNCTSEGVQLTTEKILTSASLENPKIRATEFGSPQHSLLSDFQKFASAANDEVYEMDQRIESAKAPCHQASNMLCDSRQLKISKLHARNRNLKAKLNDYVQFGSGNWYDFKREFDNELKRIENACSAISI